MDHRFLSFLLTGCLLLNGCQQKSGETTEEQGADAKPQTTVSSDASDTFNVPPIAGDIIPASGDSSQPIDLSQTKGNAQPGEITTTPVELAAPLFPKPEESETSTEPVASPETPTEPALPTDPQESVKPAEPVVTPETPTEPALPTDPQENVKPAEPVESSETSETPAEPSVNDSSAVSEPLEKKIITTNLLVESSEAKTDFSAQSLPSAEMAPTSAVSSESFPETTAVKADRIPQPVIETTTANSETQEEELLLSSTFNSDSPSNTSEAPESLETPEAPASEVQNSPAEPTSLAKQAPPAEQRTVSEATDSSLEKMEPPVPLVVKPIENTSDNSAEVAIQTPSQPAVALSVPELPVKQKLADSFAATGNSSGTLPVAPEESVIPAPPLPSAVLPVAAPQSRVAPQPISAPRAVAPMANADKTNVSETQISETNASESEKTESFDPVKENGPIFVDWPKPIATLVITGQQMGYLEPCGCAGLDRMKGGLSRRYTMVDQLRKAGWNVIPIDVGGMVDGFGKQAELKFHTTAQAMRAMGYKGVALGKGELGFPAADLLSEMVNPDGTAGMFVSCNASVFEKNADMPPQVKIIQAGSLKFGITSVLCKSAQNYTQNDEIILSDTRESLVKAAAKLKAASDIRILLSHGTVEEAQAIAADFPDFQVIVTAGGAPEPPAKPTILPSGQYIITVGQKGMNAVVLALFDDGKVRYQRVPQDSRFAQSEVVRGFMQSYQDQLKELWLAGLGIKPVPQTDPAMGAYIGPKKCATCHERQYDIWRKTKHATAFSSLEKAVPARHFDPECVCCHVVGWHRHLYFPYKTGFLDHEKDQHLKNVSCEACHGPGEAHLNAEASNNTQLQEELRKKLHIDLEYAKTRMCGDCHDLDNSPEFDFEKYWPQIVHDNEDEE